MPDPFMAEGGKKIENSHLTKPPSGLDEALKKFRVDQLRADRYEQPPEAESPKGKGTGKGKRKKGKG